MSLSPIEARISSLVKKRDAAAWLKTCIGIALAGLILYAATAENPWNRHLPDKLREGAKFTIRDFKVAGLWVASVVNAALCVLLLVTARWWGSAGASPPVHQACGKAGDRPGPAVIGRRWFWCLALAAVLLGAWQRWPAMGHSLVNDEELALRKFVWGMYERQESGSLELKRVGWDLSLYYTMTGNNHVAHTVCSRLCLNAWQKVSGARMETFSEIALRLEPLLSGLAAILFMALLGEILECPACGLFGAFLLALHPWHLAYSAMARGYSGHLLFVLVALVFLALAFRDRHRWRWWLGYGAAQSLYLLFYAGGVYMAAGLNAALLAGFLLGRDWLALRRWFAVCVLGAMGFLQIMGPAIWKILHWMHGTSGGTFPVPAGFVSELWSNLTGIVPADVPASNVVTHIIAPLLLVAGAVALSVGTRFGRYAVSGFALAGGLVVLQLSIKPGEFYTWYLFGSSGKLVRRRRDDGRRVG